MRDLPHLTLYESYPFYHGIIRSPDGESMWSARIIGLSVDEIVPVLSVTVKRAVSISIEANLIASEHPCCGLVLISDWNAMVQPVLDICTPLY